ncbi:hypothetical protein MPSEU_000715000 [Mayamaea pseudoterrestris]|nr:hypothetical protein MPSEU_000715000 [Mayamaea pseudoterrestris]
MRLCLLALTMFAFSSRLMSVYGLATTTPSLFTRRAQTFLTLASRRRSLHRFSTTVSDNDATIGAASTIETDPNEAVDAPLYLEQGLFCVYKPCDWTSSNVVSYLRKILERDATVRGARPSKVGSRKNKSRVIKVGHGGTLDPLATGVLVIGVGSGTKQLQSFLDGSKRYRAGGELGFETTTLDMEGNVTKREPFEHVTPEHVAQILPSFVGTIDQIPPIYSAIRKDGKRLYEQARQGVTAEEVDIPSRQVVIHGIDLLSCDIPAFTLDVECGGGTYIRSLIRDIGYKLGTAATTTSLERTKQGQFTLDDAIMKDDWSAESIYAAIAQFNQARMEESALADESG